MANRDDLYKDGSKSSSGSQSYVVDSGRLFDLPIYQGIKPERDMLTKLIIWLWYFPGAPCWVVSICAFVFGWIHFGDAKEFITLMITGILGISKAIVLWAEKGDVVKNKIKKLFFNRKRNQYLKQNKRERNRFK